ncbi:methyl-accepting chemotaxis protein [Bradyrhizobium sp. USDA 4472]
MFRRINKAVQDAIATAQAIDRSQAVIEFEPNGRIVTANANFLAAVGYSLPEIQGKHHSIFVPPAEREKPGYAEFWKTLARGEFQAAQYQRIRKDGSPLWIQATYNPILGKDGKPYKVVKLARDITAEHVKNLEQNGKIAALDRAQAVIEFDLNGVIITANENFLGVMGYGLAEIVGKHHSIFVDPNFAASAAYKEGWAKLNRGELVSGEFKRLAKGNREVWILASYNPILDELGKPIKIVKFATDVTRARLESADTKGQIEAIRKSQAVIEFAMDGTIQWANVNFLGAMGYALGEVKGKHHSMFVDPAERGSFSYKEFWDRLRAGEYQAGEFKRLAKGGREIWIEASYNPIIDPNGKPFKVVKYATDVTEKAVARMKAEEAKGLIHSVAAGSEEMSASIREISETMVKARSVVDTAVSRVEGADGQAQRLTTATDAMGGIVELIANITGQINLLALNATIESARAGEAGRGFAVVASEVKSLASQAKQATDKINAEIGALTGASGDVLGALNAIKSAIVNVDEYVTSTAAAVDEQSAVTADMASNMQRAALALA